MYKTPCVKKYAFSLVELSIVLVILGLLVGGILAGQSLIRASELRSVSTEFTRYQTAFHAFKDKYFAFPGDFDNAYSFWGAALGCTNVSVHSNAAGCNGNNNKRMDVSTGEPFRMWQHLAAAGLIEGSYTGTHTGLTAVIGTNVPASKLSGGGYGMNYVSPSSYTAWPTTTIANYLRLGAATANDNPIAPILSTEDVWNLDTKLDDGMPALGKYHGGQGYPSAGTCTTGAGTAAIYALTNTGKICGFALSYNW